MANHNENDRSERMHNQRRRVLWTQELMCKVIDAIKGEQLLWNPKHVDFKHRSKKMAAYNRVAAQLQLPTEAVRQKWDVLKGSYHKNRRALENQQANTIKWFAFDRLSFLGPAAGEVCGASDVTDITIKRENMESTYMSNIQTLTASERNTPISPTADETSSYPATTAERSLPASGNLAHETPRPNNDSDGAVFERLLKAIEVGLKRHNNPTWSDILGSYVSMAVNKAGERPDTEMRRLLREVIRLMETFQDGGLADTKPSPLAFGSSATFFE